MNCHHLLARHHYHHQHVPKEPCQVKVPLLVSHTGKLQDSLRRSWWGRGWKSHRPSSACLLAGLLIHQVNKQGKELRPPSLESFPQLCRVAGLGAKRGVRFTDLPWEGTGLHYFSRAESVTYPRSQCDPLGKSSRFYLRPPATVIVCCPTAGGMGRALSLSLPCFSQLSPLL